MLAKAQVATLQKYDKGKGENRGQTTTGKTEKLSRIRFPACKVVSALLHS